MNYSELKTLVSKPSLSWDTIDVCTWLQFLGLGTLCKVFAQKTIDGSHLPLLNENTLANDFHITSTIIIKKLMKWISKGLGEFDYQLAQCAKPTTKQFEMDVEEDEGQDSTTEINCMHRPLGQSREPILVFEQIVDVGSAFLYMNSEGGKIGRLSTNKVVIQDESISREHAEIKFENKSFLIRDIGSSSGTFIKLTDPMLLKNGQVFEIGQYQFQVYEKKSYIELERSVVVESESGERRVFPKIKVKLGDSETVKIGKRGGDKGLNFPEDAIMSNIHCLITSLKGKYYLMDNQSTNGVWHKISHDMTIGEFHELSYKATVRFGDRLKFKTFAKNLNENGVSPSNPCSICYDSPKDCVILPCRHYSTCMRCSRAFQNCPICRIKVGQLLKVYLE